MSHKLHKFTLVSGLPSAWTMIPDLAALEQHLAASVLADSEVTSTTLGFYNPPQRVRRLQISLAAYDQIDTMWFGHRPVGKKSPPHIPLKLFVTGFGQNPPDTWVDVEILPGVDEWEL